MNTNKGFAPIIAIIIAVIIIAGGIGGYLYIKNKPAVVTPSNISTSTVVTTTSTVVTTTSTRQNVSTSTSVASTQKISFEVNKNATLPDFVVTSIELLPKSLGFNQKFDVIATIKNIGTDYYDKSDKSDKSDKNALGYRLQIDTIRNNFDDSNKTYGTNFWGYLHESLKSGSSTIVKWDGTKWASDALAFNVKGKQTIKFIINEDRSIKEFDTNNNSLGKEICIVDCSNDAQNKFLTDEQNNTNIEINQCTNQSTQDQKNECYWNLVVNSKMDAGFCDKITDNNLKNSCLLSSIANTNNINNCSKISNQEDKLSCYTEIVSNNSNVGLCDQLSDVTQKTLCKDSYYSANAIKTKNENLCSNIQTQSIKDKCFYEISRSGTNFSLCSKISDANLRIGCEAMNEIPKAITKEEFNSSIYKSFNVFGDVKFTNDEYVITEGAGDAGIYKSFIVPNGVSMISFKYKFLKAGDGDFFAVYVIDKKTGQDTVAYIGPDLDLTRENYVDGSAGIMPGQSIEILFELVSRGSVNAVIGLESLKME